MQGILFEANYYEDKLMNNLFSLKRLKLFFLYIPI